jgi:predicted transposase YbfD/YdcC
LLLTIIVARLASNDQPARAIAQWAHLHAEVVPSALPDLKCIPSESTLLRVLRHIDAGVLQQKLAQFVACMPTSTPYAGCIMTPQGEILQAQALDGKAVRTATAHGDRTHLVSVVHQTGRSTKRSEGVASQQLLTGHDLSGTSTTMDAGLTQRSRAQQIRQQNGHYLMVVKQNHPQMYAEVALFFEQPGVLADAEHDDRCRTVSTGYGRLETRTVECLSARCDDWHWPDAVQILRRTCERVDCKRGKRTLKISYALTSLTCEEARAMELERLWRGHWTIENRKQYVRDVTMGEDRHQMQSGQAPQVLAARRNALIDLWRSYGWSNSADALRHTAAAVQRA